ncbi:MAG TPA: OsmC family protein [Chitinophagaceae bacterium]|nr:OsmC family protein [Chitinophagaceae bacterium]
MTASIIYQGDLRCKATHLQSGTVLETDAPTDNRGKGEKFSPTDTLCVSLATCIITTMALKAMEMNIELKDSKIDITKHMLKDPRRVGQIDITIYFPPQLQLDEEQKSTLESTGNNCPVAKSLHPDLKTIIEYNW